MWPFNKTKLAEEDSAAVALTRQWNEIKSTYYIGKEFSYLGRKMIVTRYEIFNGKPYLVTEYSDNMGQLHQHEFLYQAFEFLLTK